MPPSDLAGGIARYVRTPALCTSTSERAGTCQRALRHATQASVTITAVMKLKISQSGVKGPAGDGIRSIPPLVSLQNIAYVELPSSSFPRGTPVRMTCATAVDELLCKSSSPRTVCYLDLPSDEKCDDDAPVSNELSSQWRHSADTAPRRRRPRLPSLLVLPAAASSSCFAQVKYDTI